MNDKIVEEKPPSTMHFNDDQGGIEYGEMMNTSQRLKEKMDKTKSRMLIAPTEKTITLNLPPISSPQYQARYGGTFLDHKRTRY